MIEICTSTMILKDGRYTGYSVVQAAERTEVRKYDINSATNEVVKMPQERYSLSSDKPASGIPGREQFAKDFEAMLNDQ